MLAQFSHRFRNWLDSDYKIKKFFISVHYYTVRHKLWQKITSLSTKDKFTEIYRNNLWNNEESRSGGGSTVSRTSKIRNQLPELLRAKGIGSICDAGCGDFNWMKHVDLRQIEYIGVDIVGEMIAANNRNYGSSDKCFLERDIIRDVLPMTDLILCREVLHHLSFEDICSATINFKKCAKYLIATSNPYMIENVDIVTAVGCRDLNFLKPPFNFPPPIQTLEENLSGKCLAMWSLNDIDAEHFEK
jgi:SAM-dependent methyltransferase